MQIRFTSNVATASLPAASAPSGERKRTRGNVPGKWNAKSWTARAPVGTLSSVPLGDESLRGRKDFQSLLMAH